MCIAVKHLNLWKASDLSYSNYKSSTLYSFKSVSDILSNVKKVFTHSKVLQLIPIINFK